MITGAHSIIFSTNPEADRAFLRNVLELPHVDAGEGWLIMALPPAEVAVHPSDRNDVHELYLICDDVRAFIAEMEKRDIECSPVQDQNWGLLTRLRLPGGGTLGVYEPRHVRPKTRRAGGKGKGPSEGGAKRRAIRRQENQERDLPAGLAKPAQRALAGAGISRLEQLARVSEAEVRQLHGIGPNALAQLRRALKAKGMSYAAEKKKR